MLENKIPPPIIAAVFAVIMWFVAPFLPILEARLELRIILTICLLASGIFACLSGVLSFRLAKTTVNPLKPESASSLVDTGIYKFTRNPMYLGFALFLGAWTTFLSSPILIFGIVGFVFYMNRFQITPEERALTEIFGEEFETYQSSVRRWL